MPGTIELMKSYEEKWEHRSHFEISTSGSTGKPKPWLYKRDLLEWSALQTKKYFVPATVKKQLIALPLDKAGGFFQWVRSKVWNMPFDWVEPSANPLLEYKGDAQLMSLTPMQIRAVLEHELSREKLSQFHAVLIGGAPIDPGLEATLTKEFSHISWTHTFGMTETYSHFAGRALGQEYYRCIDDTEIRINAKGQLEINNPITQGWLTTQDIVHIEEDQTFKWFGRSDFVINSGGIKIQLETIEQALRLAHDLQEDDFFCWWQPDSALGQALIACVKTGVPIPIKWKVSNPYFQPKATFQFETLITTKTGKINRRATSELIIRHKG